MSPSITDEDWPGVKGIDDVRRLRVGMIFTRDGEDIWEVVDICEVPCIVLQHRMDGQICRHLKQQDFCNLEAGIWDVKHIFTEPSLTLKNLRIGSVFTGEQGDERFADFTPLVPDKDWCREPVEGTPPPPQAPSTEDRVRARTLEEHPQRDLKA